MNSAIGTLQNLVDSLSSQGVQPAIITLTRDGRQTTTYSQLGDTSHRLATGLIQAGPSPGCPVVLFAPNQTNWVMAICAIIEARGIPVPIDSQMQSDDLKHVLLSCGALWIFTTTHLERSLHSLKLPNEFHIIHLNADKQRPQRWQHHMSKMKKPNFQGPHQMIQLSYFVHPVRLDLLGGFPSQSPSTEKGNKQKLEKFSKLGPKRKGEADEKI